MKIVIFAGGVGTRLWPVSRKHTPKQFEKIIGDKSTLQQTTERLQPEFSWNDIYIATGKHYEKIVIEQLPEIPKENFIFEPQMRDVGPAIGLVSALLEKRFPDEPIAIIWSDHIVRYIDAFKKGLMLAENLIYSKKAQFVYIAQKPRFANQNMGWIELGSAVEENGKIPGEVTLYRFKRLCYRPSIEEARTFFSDEHYVWNLGYFVTTPKYLTTLFSTFAPDMYDQLQKISTAPQASYEQMLDEIYPAFEKVSFDDLILVKMSPDHVYVISADLGWSDVGAWESLKEALSATQDENVTKGEVLLEDSRDSLAFNYKQQLLVGIDLDEMLVINTDDVLLVCPKTSVPKIKKLVEKLAGTPHEHLT